MKALAVSALVCLSALACSGPEPPARHGGQAARTDAAPRSPAARPEPAADLAAAYARRSEANAAYDAKDYVRAASLFAQAARLDPGAADEDHYGEACCFALAGDKGGAFDALDRALSKGLRDRAQLDHDTDFTPLRDEPRWPGVLARAQGNADAYLKGSNPELRRLHDEDQADRRGAPAIDWKVVSPRDAARRKRVREILDAGGAKTAADHYNAAMVFQHGSEVADFRMAHDLARKAAELDPHDRHAKWLAAASKDRELMNLGQPQLYGTQFRRVEGRWELYQVDPSIGDEERARWRVPPLAEAKRRADVMNAARLAEPRPSYERRVGLRALRAP